MPDNPYIEDLKIELGLGLYVSPQPDRLIDISQLDELDRVELCNAVLGELALLAELDSFVVQRIDQLAPVAVRLGGKWPVIADATKMSRQGARQRWMPGEMEAHRQKQKVRRRTHNDDAVA